MMSDVLKNNDKIQTSQTHYTERDWQRLVGWGWCPKERLIKDNTADEPNTNSVSDQNHG